MWNLADIFSRMRIRGVHDFFRLPLMIFFTSRVSGADRRLTQRLRLLMFAPFTLGLPPGTVAGGTVREGSTE